MDTTTTTTTASETLVPRPYFNVAPRTLKQLESSLRKAGFNCEFNNNGLCIKELGQRTNRTIDVQEYLTPYYFWYGIRYADASHQTLVIAEPENRYCASPAYMHYLVTENLRLNGAPEGIEIFTEGTRVWVEKNQHTSKILSEVIVFRQDVSIQIVYIDNGKPTERGFYVLRGKNAVQL